MNSLADSLAGVERALSATAAEAFGSGELRRLDDDAVLSLMTTVAGIVRQAEAVLLAVVGEVEQREDAGAQPLRPTTRHGCRSMKELVQRATRLPGRRVGEVMRAAHAIQQPVSFATGEVLAAKYPAMREAAADGIVGVDAVAAVVFGLDAADCSDDARRAADGEIATSARGEGGDGGPVPSADDLRLQAQVWAMYLDQDGAEPREARALRKRGLTLGVCHDGLVPLRGHLLPEVAGQVQQLFDSILNPKGDGPDAPAGPPIRRLRPPPTRRGCCRPTHTRPAAARRIRDRRDGGGTVRRASDDRRCRAHARGVGRRGRSGSRARPCPTSTGATSRSRSPSPGRSRARVSCSA